MTEVGDVKIPIFEEFNKKTGNLTGRVDTLHAFRCSNCEDFYCSFGEEEYEDMTIDSYFEGMETWSDVLCPGCKKNIIKFKHQAVFTMRVEDKLQSESSELSSFFKLISTMTK